MKKYIKPIAKVCVINASALLVGSPELNPSGTDKDQLINERFDLFLEDEYISW